MNRVRRLAWRVLWRVRSRYAKGLQVGDVLPNFSLPDAGGRVHSLSDVLPGKGLVLWFTNFCEDCRSKIPLLNEVVEKANSRFGVLAVSLLGEDVDWPVRCGETASFPFLIDAGDIAGRKLGLQHPGEGCPLYNVFFVGPSGRILFRHHLSALNSEQFRKIWQGFM